LGHGLLFEARPFDPTTFGAFPMGLMLVLTRAFYRLARRASRIDPLTALRHEWNCGPITARLGFRAGLDAVGLTLEVPPWFPPATLVRVWAVQV
jgi:hypothetical protein